MSLYIFNNLHFSYKNDLGSKYVTSEEITIHNGQICLGFTLQIVTIQGTDFSVFLFRVSLCRYKLITN